MRELIGGAFVLAALIALPGVANGQQGVQPWDGSNPFACTLQELGTSTTFPDPGADPFCVEYDKTHQNVLQLGVVDFLAAEPARVAAASPKCFYYQRDHWTGSISEGQQPTTYHFDGSYFFDKARGVGGVHIGNFQLAGQEFDVRQLPGFPDAYRPYFGPGGGGAQSSGDVPVDPQCSAPSASGGGGPSCRVAGGRVTLGIGGVWLGNRRSYVRRAMSRAARESARYMSWCFEGGGQLLAAFSAAGNARAELVLTDAPPFDTRGIRTGSTARVVRHNLPRARSVGRARGSSVLRVAEGCREARRASPHRSAAFTATQRSRPRVLYVGIARQRVAFLAITRCGLSTPRALRDLREQP